MDNHPVDNSKSLYKECWNLDHTLAKIILPKLLWFKNFYGLYSYPNDLEDSEEWEEILNDMIWSFSFIAHDHIFDIAEEGRDRYLYLLAKCQHGLNLFAEYYLDLWN